MLETTFLPAVSSVSGTAALLAESNGAPLLVASIVWFVVVLGFYVWYLWSLSRLFPLIGLPSSHGWIPVWNQWQLLQRGGMPGWIVLLGFTGFLSPVVFIVTVIAVHRLNVEHGKGPGFTVLGALLPPVWAMLLAKSIEEARQPDAVSVFAVGGQDAQQPVGQVPGMPGFPAPQSYDQQQYEAQQQYDQQAQLFAAPAPSNQAYPQQQAAPQQYDQQQYAAPLPAAPQQYAPDQQQYPQYGAPPQAAPVAPLPQPARVQPQAPEPFREAEPMSAQPAQVPSAPPAQQDEWGFSRATQENYQRLASVDEQPRTAAPLGAPVPDRPFAWPAFEESNPRLIFERSESSPADEQRSASPFDEPARPEAEPARAETGPAAPEPSDAVNPWNTGGQAAADRAPEFERSEPASSTSAPSLFSAPAEPVAAPDAPAPAPAVSAPEAPAATSAPAPAAPAPAAVSTPAATSTAPAADDASQDEDDEFDRTVVVDRGPRWGIELPDGEVLELRGDVIVVGRKPLVDDGTSALRIPDPTRTMSKSHARLRRVGDGWTIEDLDSTNGVAIVNARGEQVQIEPGREVAATEQLVIGTLEVSLTRIR